MADNNDVSQFSVESSADGLSTSVTQDVTETGASESNALISQSAPEFGAVASTAFISQEPTEFGANKSSPFVSQITVEYGRGPESAPPEDNPTGTFTVGAGLGLPWFIALQLSDSGMELRDKLIKSLRVTGKTTNGMIKVYGFGPKEDVNVQNIEDGIGQRATVILPDTQQVQQTKRFQVNVPNSMMHTVRIEGRWTGEGIADRIDESIYETSRQGVRR